MFFNEKHIFHIENEGRSPVVSFSRNVVLSGLSFSSNVVRKRAMFSVRADYVRRPLQLGTLGIISVFGVPSAILRHCERASARLRMRGHYTYYAHF